MQSQKELFQRQIELEREELRFRPEKETRGAGRALPRQGPLRGQRPTWSRAGSCRIPEHALDTKIREELGLDPDELGSPWGAALLLVPRLRSRRARAAGALPASSRASRPSPSRSCWRSRRSSSSAPWSACSPGREPALQRPAPGHHRRGGSPRHLRRGQPHRRERRRLTTARPDMPSQHEVRARLAARA